MVKQHKKNLEVIKCQFIYHNILFLNQSYMSSSKKNKTTTKKTNKTPQLQLSFYLLLPFRSSQVKFTGKKLLCKAKRKALLVTLKETTYHLV